jgi:cytochrome P450
MCLGLHLARQETFAAMEKLLDRFPQLRLDEKKTAPRMQGFWFPGVDRLPVVW